MNQRKNTWKACAGLLLAVLLALGSAPAVFAGPYEDAYAKAIAVGNTDAYAAQYAAAYAKAIADGKTDAYAAIYAINYQSYGREDRATAEATAYTIAIAAGKDEAYAKTYAFHYQQALLGDGKSADYATHFAAAVAEGKSEISAHIIATAAVSGETYTDVGRTSPFSNYDQTKLYTELVFFGGTSKTYAAAYTTAYFSGKGEAYAVAYATAIDDGKSEAAAEAAAKVYIKAIADGKGKAYAKAYAEAIDDGMGETYANAYATAIADGKGEAYAKIYATAIADGKSEAYAEAAAKAASQAAQTDENVRLFLPATHQDGQPAHKTFTLPSGAAVKTVYGNGVAFQSGVSSKGCHFTYVINADGSVTITFLGAGKGSLILEGTDGSVHVVTYSNEQENYSITNDRGETETVTGPGVAVTYNPLLNTGGSGNTGNTCIHGTPSNMTCYQCEAL